MTDTPDRIAAYLDEVWERYNAGADFPLAGTAKAITDSSDDVPRLLRLARDVLALLDDWDGEAAALDRKANLPAMTERTADLLLYRAQALTGCVTRIRRVISADLLGEGDRND